MRTIFTITATILFLFSQIQQVSAQSGPLNGTYTVGTGGYYTTLSAAIDSLVSRGINGPVLLPFNQNQGIVQR
jgi:hypothetical protein